jgi:hypothetical protein
MALGSTHRLTEMSTRYLHSVKERPALKTDNLTAICESGFLENVTASTSNSPMGLRGLLQG